MANAVIGSLRVNLGLDTAAFQEGMAQAKGHMAKIGPMLARVGAGVAAAGAAIGAAGISAAQGAAEMQKLAQLSNAGLAEFQKAAAAAQTVGVEQEKLADIFKDVNDKIGEFMSSGGGELADFFKNVAPKAGVAAKDFANLSGPKALGLFVKTLEKADLNPQQMTHYMESIADEASALTPLLTDNAAEWERLGKQAEKYGLASGQSAADGKALSEALANVGRAARSVGDAIAQTGLIGLMADLINFSADVIKGFADATKAVGENVRAMITTVREMVGGFREQLADLPEQMAQIGRDIIGGLWRGLQEKFESVKAGVGDFASGIADSVRGVLGIQSPSRVFHEIGMNIMQGLALGIGDGRGGLQPALSGMVDDFRRTGEEMRRVTDDLARTVTDGLTRLADAAISRTGDVRDAVKALALDLASIGIKAGAQAIFGNMTLGGPKMYPVQGFASGTNFAPGGLAMVGERGPELVNLPRGSQVIPNHELGGRDGGRVHIELDPGLRASFLDDAAQQSVAITRAGVSATPAIVNNMRRRGR